MASPSRSQAADGADTGRTASAPGGRTAPVTTLSEEDLSSAAQRDRRKRILDATLALASKGGYDAVQMRAVAERADVAVGTLYRYFPSKVHLLVSALAREFEQFEGRRKPSFTPPRRSACTCCSTRSPAPCSATRCSPRP